MTTMNISLPESLKDFVDEQVKRGYGTSSEYVRELIRKDQDRERVRGLLLKGAASPATTLADKAYFRKLRIRTWSSAWSVPRTSMSGASCTVNATSLPGCTSPTRCDEAWCMGPDSNRHGVARKGFSYHCSFRCSMRGPSISWSGLYLCRPVIDRSLQSD